MWSFWWIFRKKSRGGQALTKQSFSFQLIHYTAEALKNVIDNLKAVTTLTKQYGSKKIKQISGNFDTDPGFFFAYMSTDITELEKQDKEKKNNFLKELKELVDKYSQDDNGIEIYE